MNSMKKAISASLALAMAASCCAVPSWAAEADETVDIVLSDSAITVDGEAVSESEDAAVYTSHDIIYYEDRDTYDSGNTYGAGSDEDKHSAEEAAAHTVVNITQPGTYRITGELSQGQIAIDLGDDAKTDPDAVVTLILDDADITCTVAPAVIFYSVYECDTAWTAYEEDESVGYTASATQDTSAAGANVILADGSVNNISGSYVAKIYKDNGNEKKLYKFDGAFYSKMSMNIDGEEEDSGVLNIEAENEGLDTELHLSINGGKVNIQSQDDGINTNEDGVSVTTINGGSLHIVAGLGSEGDGIDSNGYLTINGGTVIATANPAADSGLDSDMGSYVNGGTVLATGSTMDWAESDSNQVTMNLQFAAAQGADEAIVVTDLENNVLFAYDPDKDETTGSYNRSYQGAVLSCAGFTVGESYYVYVGGDVTGTETDGLYDVSTVTSFTGAVRQVYTGTDVGMGGMNGDPGGNPGGMTPPDGDSGSMTPPDGDSGSMTPPSGTPGQPGSDDSTSTGDSTTDSSTSTGDEALDDNMFVNPDGSETTVPRPTDSGSLPEMPDGAVNDGGQTPPDGGMTPPDQNGGNAGDSTSSSNTFYMTDKVNAFSGVQDEEGYEATTITVPGKETEPTTSPSTEPTTEPSTEPTDTPSTTVSFSDVSESDWFYSYVTQAASAGIIDGYEDNTFKPTQSLTRAEAVKLIVTAAGLTVDEDAKTDFSDAADNWASAYIAAAVQAGIVNGYEDGTFKPDASVTRAEFVKMIAAAASLTVDESAKADFSDTDESWASAYIAAAVQAGIVDGYEDNTFRPDNTILRSEAAKMIVKAFL